ncbi:MAG: PPC domain-containing protein [Myxococcota bacterium]
MTKLLRLSFLLAFSLAMACSSAEPVNQTHNGSLAQGDPQHPRDQSWYDEYEFQVEEGWTITVDMVSDKFDTYLQLRRKGIGDDQYLQENDDVAEGNTNSRIATTAPAGGTYVVWANAYEANQGGEYLLTIRAEPGAK